MIKKEGLQKIKQIINKWLVFLVGFSALVWFLIRVIPKPSRAAYPCQRAAFPIASAFVIWVGGVFATSFLFKKARAKFAESKNTVAIILLIISVISSFLVINPGHFESLSAGTPSVQDEFIPIDDPNDPMGVGRGIFPGRVVWSYDSAATSWSGVDGFWWSDTSTDSVKVKYMFSKGLKKLTEEETEMAAWDAIFRYYNKNHDKGDVGYSAGEKIAIKINMNMIKTHDQENNSISVSPQVIQALLKQLVYHAKVPASAISFYDISRLVPDYVYNRCKEEFPDVHFIDGSAGENGREPYSLDINTEIKWSDTLVIGKPSYLPTIVTEADYIINLANLKGHTLAGVTMNAKNHFGTYHSGGGGNGPIDAGVHPFIATGDNAPSFGTKRDMGTYNALVDIMGHEHLGEKTLLFILDALYNTAYQNTQLIADYKLDMPPFDGDWMSSIFVSLDGVAIESVGLDFLHAEPGPAGEYVVGNVDNYLHEAAQADNPPSGMQYDPEGDGTFLISLGVHEHWNDHINKQYSRNLGKDEGIELSYIDASTGATTEPTHADNSLLTAYKGITPVLDGFISEGEYSDAESITGVKDWYSDTGIACEDSLDLSVRVYYKHDGAHLFFAFDVTDNILYGFDTERWLPAANPDANSLVRGEGWPWFGDGLEIMMNPSYTWDDTKKSVGDGTIWQTICSTHKSFAGGLEFGGLIEGIPYTEYAWTNYQDWYINEYMKASVRIKSEDEGSGYVVEWRISPNPCMQIDESNYVDLSKESKVGINLEFEDLDRPEDGQGTGNLVEFRHVDYMSKLPDLRKNIAKGFATLVLTPEKMNPDSLISKISEDYEEPLEPPVFHSLALGTDTEIDVQADACGNNSLVIEDLSPSDSAQALLSFLWMDKTVNSSFDITPGQSGGSIHFDLLSDENQVIRISLGNDSIRYYQNGSSSAWKSYAADTKYRIQIIADMQGRKYSLDVNGDMLQDLDFQDPAWSTINGFRIQTTGASVGTYEFDNLIIQEETIETADFFPFESCWDLRYDYEGSDNVPPGHIVTAEPSTGLAVEHSTSCDNNFLLFPASSSDAPTRVEVPFGAANNLVHVQFALDAGQDNASFHVDLREGENTLVKVGLSSSNKISYYQDGSMVDSMVYRSNTKYSFQIIANMQTLTYDFIVDSDTMKNISFYDGTGTSIDNLTMSTLIPTIGDFRVDNLAISNRVLSELAIPFDACLEPVTDPSSIEAIGGGFKLYPNPSSGSVTLEFALPHPNPIIVTDLYGREIYRMNGTMDKTMVLDLPNLESGIYLINFDNELGRFGRLIQFIKQ